MTASVESLEASYEKFAAAYSAAFERGDHRTANRNHDKLRALVPQLRACGDQGQAALVRLMRVNLTVLLHGPQLIVCRLPK